MNIKRIGSAFAYVLLAGSSAMAQTAPPGTLPSVAVSPTNVLLPNYNGVPIGEIGGLEGGAFLARADDSSSVFYNPAGLTRAEKTSVSGTAGTYQFGGFSADHLGKSTRSFQQVPAMFAFVLKNVLHRDNLSAGVSVARTAAWRQTVDVELATQEAGGPNRLSYSSAAQFDQYLASAGVGYAGHGRWRVGGSLDLQFTNTDRRQAVANQYQSPGLSSLLVTSRGDASSSHVRLTAGTQYNLTSKVIAGAVFRTRGLRLRSGGTSMLEGVNANGTTTTTGSFFDDDVDVTFKVPLEFKSGVAYLAPRGQVEFDLLVYGGAGTYNAYESDRPVTVITGSATTSSTTVYAATPPVIDSETVVNVAIGGQLKMTSNGAWVLHGGYGTDRSPVGELDTVFTKAHLQRFTAGVSARTSHFLGSIGVNYATGRSDPVPLRELPSGQITTRFHVKTVGLVYSMSVLF